MGSKKFVGFGFGPIQSGLMLLEAMKSGNFDTFTIVEVDPVLVDLIRKNNNAISINIAMTDRIVTERLTGFTILNPRNIDERELILKAIANADEMATAIPSVDFYDAGGDSSIVALLAHGVTGAKKQILYASENNNYAAEILTEKLIKSAPPENLHQFDILNTVIGKMSGVKQSESDIRGLGLVPLVPGGQRAVLVEAFNRIYVSKPRFPFTRGITVFEEKDNLLPFEEAKLFGHNAIHSLLGYMASDRGYRVMSEIRKDRELMEIGRQAFLSESGTALIRKHGSTGDQLFTPAGYKKYADDLLDRMTNPYLHDEVERICRDPKRKLGYGDRLVGTMREALREKVTPILLARGAASCLRYIQKTGGIPEVDPSTAMDSAKIAEALQDLWKNDQADQFQDDCIRLIQRAW